jgi:photosystem II stability/assembly factor-like uncharacterized protein
MSPVQNLRKFLAYVLIWSLFITGLLAFTPRQGQASNSSLRHTLTPKVKESTEENGPQAKTVDEATRARVSEAYGKLPLRFETNWGQFDSQAQFLVRGGGYSLFLTSSAATMVLTKPAAHEERVHIAKSTFEPQPANNLRGKREQRLEEDARSVTELKSAAPESAVLRLKLEGANSSAQVAGLDELPGKSNYFIGNDPNKWLTAIPSYAKVIYREVYPGVDLIYYGKEQQVEYDFLIAPGGDPGQIKLNFEGAQSVKLDVRGDLVLHTEAGDMRQQKPMVYQLVDGVKREIPARYEMTDGQRVGFHMDAYDTSKPLVIDPILIYSTVLGGSTYNEGNSIAIDADGNAYVAGFTYSSNFPLVNAAQANGYGFVSKLNPIGSALVYSTYVGSITGYDNLSGIAVDAQGSAYVTGYTSSPVFPVVNAVQTTLGGKLDPIAIKLSPDGSALLYSTYLGGSNDDEGKGIAVDASGNAYIAGYTNSNDFAVVNAFQSKKSGNQAFKSTNSGGSWRVSESGLNLTSHIFDIVIDPAHPSTLYIATDEGVFKSTNSGDTWRDVNTSTNINLSSSLYGNLALDPSNTSTIFAGTDNGLFKSTNGGDTWTRSLSTRFIEAVAIDPVNPYTIYASPSRYISKSTDGGSSWRQVGPNTEFTCIAINPINNSILYAGTAYNSLYKSTNGGSSWRLLNSFPAYVGYITDLVIDPSNPSIVYASGSGGVNYGGSGIYKSTDEGSHWQQINNGLPSAATYVHTMAVDPVHPSVLYASALDGIYKTTDGGAHWRTSSTGLTKDIIRRIAIDPTAPSKLYAVRHSWEDAFITKLSPSGATRVYSTYLGGTGPEMANGIALDSQSNVYLTGRTSSLNFPLKNPLRRAYGGVFITKLAASGSSLAYSTYFGGSNGNDTGNGIAVDSSGNAYVTGETIATDFPVTPGAFQTTLQGWISAFVAKINAAGSSVVYSTYLGGNSETRASAISINPSGEAFVTGLTASPDFPLANEIQSTLRGPQAVFVTRLNATGSALIFSTYLGGTYGDYNEIGRGIAVDSASYTYVAGTTGSSDFPTTSNAFQKHAGFVNAFITKIGEPPASIQFSGSVLRNGAGVDGVNLTLKNGAGDVLQTTTTLSDGSYSFNAPGGGDYTVTPSKPDCVFRPSSISHTQVGTDLPLQDFEARKANVMIQVQVPGLNENGVPGINISLSGSRSATCTTDSSGLCAFTGLPGFGNYTVAPSKTGATFTPTSRAYNDPDGDQLAIFDAAFTVSGQIKGLGGIGIGGVTVKLSGDRTLSKLTDSSGNFKFTGLPAGGHYIITPSRAGTTFSPAFVEINNLNAPAISGFQALVSITGKVRLQGTTTGISGVMMNLTGSRSATTMTDSSGIYTFSNLPAGGDYTVTPSLTGYSFNPPSRTFTGLIVSKGLSVSYFDGTH